MFKKYWHCFCLLALVIVVLLIMGATGEKPPANLDAFTNSMQNYFLNPRNQKPIDNPEKKECRPKNEEDKSCELYRICKPEEGETCP